jgi:fatty acid desaturase
MARSDSGRESPILSDETPAVNAGAEWPTVGLIALIYGGWIGATLLHRHAPPLALFIIGGWLVAWQGSLQHEAIHGHPTPWQWVNDTLASAPLSLWLPYEIYKRTHVAHHASEHLTHPAYDPEARYLAAGAGGLARAAALGQSTLAGRMVLGPAVEIAGFLAKQAGRVARNEEDSRRVWGRHLVAVSLVWAWLHFACHFSLAAYLLFFVYPGVALALLRSFAEHRADTSPGARVAVVERSPLLGLLFLNNNLHAAHHRWPGLAWWRLPEAYRTNRQALLAENGGLVYASYGEVAARFLFRPHDTIHHPDGLSDKA